MADVTAVHRATAAGIPVADLAGVFRALGDENRLRIFSLLAGSELCVCELEDRLALPQSLVSNHLAVLRRSGLVEARRDEEDARWIFYRANPAAVALLRHRCDALLRPAPRPPDRRRALEICRVRGR